MGYDLDPMAYLKGQGHSTYIPNKCPYYKSSLPCLIWIIFHTSVARYPKVYHELDQRSYFSRVKLKVYTEIKFVLGP